MRKLESEAAAQSKLRSYYSLALPCWHSIWVSYDSHALLHFSYTPIQLMCCIIPIDRMVSPYRTRRSLPWRLVECRPPMSKQLLARRFGVWQAEKERIVVVLIMSPVSNPKVVYMDRSKWLYARVPCECAQTTADSNQANCTDDTQPKPGYQSYDLSAR